MMLFAHVPRCAGSSVENHLHGRFGTLMLLDRGHYQRPGPFWSRTSPQHADADTLNRLIPPNVLAAGFTIVRHPAKRIESVFFYQRDVEKRLPEGTTLSGWLRGLPDQLRADPFQFDNHLRPMTEMVPPGMLTFRLEEQDEGMPAVVEFIDTVSGAGPHPMPRLRRIAVVNSRAQRLDQAASGPRGPVDALAEADLELIADLYAEDYRRFGYGPVPGMLVDPAPDQPAPGAP